MDTLLGFALLPVHAEKQPQRELPQLVAETRAKCALSGLDAAEVKLGRDVRVILTAEELAWLAVKFDLDSLPTLIELSKIIQSGLLARVEAAKKEHGQ